MCYRDDVVLSVGAFEVLQVAVNMARDLNIRTRKELKARLNTAFPDRQDDVAAALDKWAAYVQKRGYSA